MENIKIPISARKYFLYDVFSAQFDHILFGYLLQYVFKEYKVLMVSTFDNFYLTF